MLSTENHKWFKVISIKISLQHVDFWAKSLLFRTHHLWNSRTELILQYSSQLLNIVKCFFFFLLQLSSLESWSPNEWNDTQVSIDNQNINNCLLSVCPYKMAISTTAWAPHTFIQFFLLKIRLMFRHMSSYQTYVRGRFDSCLDKSHVTNHMFEES